MRYAVPGDHHAPADRPSDACGTDEEAAPPAAAARSRVKRWSGVVVSVAVAVALAIAFVPLPDLGSLLGDDETGAADSSAVDADAQRVYWEDLQPRMCVREVPIGMDYVVVDCSAEHGEEVMSRGTLAGSKE